MAAGHRWSHRGSATLDAVLLVWADCCVEADSSLIYACLGAIIRSTQFSAGAEFVSSPREYASSPGGVDECARSCRTRRSSARSLAAVPRQAAEGRRRVRSARGCPAAAAAHRQAEAAAARTGVPPGLAARRTGTATAVDRARSAEPAAGTGACGAGPGPGATPGGNCTTGGSGWGPPRRDVRELVCGKIIRGHRSVRCRTGRGGHATGCCQWAHSPWGPGRAGWWVPACRGTPGRDSCAHRGLRRGRSAWFCRAGPVGCRAAWCRRETGSARAE